MGGTVSVIIQKDSVITPMKRWTNSLPSFLNNIKFINRDSDHLEKYLSVWNSMKKDWEQNSSSGKYEFNMTSVYSPYPWMIAPCDYGIIFIDFDKKFVMGSQGYCSVGREYFGQLEIFEQKLSVPEKFKSIFGEKDYKPNNEFGIPNDIFDLYQSGRIKKAIVYDRKSMEKEIKIDIPQNDIQKASNFIKEIRRDKRVLFYEIEIDMNPWTIFNLDTDCESVAFVKKYIQNDLGIKLTKEEESEWESFIEVHT